MVGGGIVQVDSDGTRRFYSGNTKTSSDKVIFEGQSTDGTFIKTKTETSVKLISGSYCYYNPTIFLKYPDGTTIEHDALEYKGCYAEGEPITMVPTKISDRNGNQIKINYQFTTNNAPGRWINFITDTLGRIYNFNYKLVGGKYFLTGISGPGLSDENGNVVPRTFVTLDYKDLTINTNFIGLTPHVRENTVKVLSAIYYPSTQSGYWFGDDSNSSSPSYSTYGMIRKVEEHKAMGYDPATGAITAGQMSRQRVYSYPVNNNTAVSDVPAFGTLTESWEAMTDAAPVTTYQTLNDDFPRTSTITSPDGSKVVETSFNLSNLSDTDPEKVRDGLTYETKYYGSDDILKANSANCA